MARPVTWGTPGRSDHYLFPRSPVVILAYSLLAAFVIVVVWAALNVLGLRRPLAPGDLVSAHAPVEGRCQECHVEGRGVANARCQRCHDPAAGGRMDTRAHVLFGSGDPARSAATTNVDCARCHVEHRGRTHALAVVDQTECALCHFRRFSAHPELAALRDDLVETPGLNFGHMRHIEEVLKAARSNNPVESCGACHEFVGPDFAPVAFDRHCASCHAREGSVGEMDFVSGEDVSETEGEGFEWRRGKVRKLVVAHQDPWVLVNLQRLGAALDPSGYAALRGALVARLNQLSRRRALALPLAGLKLEELKSREAALGSEIRRLDARMAAVSGDPTGAEAETRSRGSEVSRAAEALGTTEGPELLVEPASKPLSPSELEARRREVLSLLDAVVAAEPETRSAADDLRRRVLALRPGGESREVLARARGERAASLERVRDEMALRDAGGLSSPNVLLQRDRRALDGAMAETERALEKLPPSSAPTAPLSPEARQPKKEALDVLTGVCTKCHVRTEAPRLEVQAARRVLVRSTFTHAPHLLPTEGDCLRCHPSVPGSTSAAPLNVLGIESCRGCHRGQGSRVDCQLCHLYHPPAFHSAG